MTTPSAAPPARVIVATILVLLCGIGLALAQAVGAERAARERAAATSAVLTLTNASLTAGLNAESGQRGFLLTEDTRYLEPYRMAQSGWIATLDALDAALDAGGAPDQHERLARMRALAGDKMLELAETIELTQAGRRDEALAIVRSDEGKRLMDAFRAEAVALEDVALALLRAGIDNADGVERRTAVLLAGLAGVIVALVLFGLRLERRRAEAEATAAGMAEVEAARARAELLAGELNHRVKNLFSVIMAIVSLSGRHESDVRTATAKIRDRIHALARAHEISQGEVGREHAEMDGLVRAVLAPYGHARFAIDGPSVALPGRAVTPLGLILHEWATNAAKYGALSTADGTVSLDWTQAADGTVRLAWRERGGPPVTAPEAKGFGSTMARQAALQLDGTVTQDWAAEGMEATLTFVPPPAAERP